MFKNKKSEDLSNQKFNKLFVIGPHHRENNRVIWECRCECGNIRYTTTGSLKHNNVKSCKTCAYSYKDYTGQKIGRLAIIRRIKDEINKNNVKRVRWECECECGNIVKRYSYTLEHSENRRMCRECRTELENIIHKDMDIKQYHWYNIKECAKYMDREFSITVEYIWDLFLKQERRCSLSGVPLFFAKTKKSNKKRGTTASLDRIDSSKGYIEGNVQWVHKDVNRMKSNYSQEKFVEICTRVYRFTKGL